MNKSHPLLVFMKNWDFLLSSPSRVTSHILPHLYIYISLTHCQLPKPKSYNLCLHGLCLLQPRTAWWGVSLFSSSIQFHFIQFNWIEVSSVLFHSKSQFITKLSQDSLQVCQQHFQKKEERQKFFLKKKVPRANPHTEEAFVARRKLLLPADTSSRTKFSVDGLLPGGESGERRESKTREEGKGERQRKKERRDSAVSRSSLASNCCSSCSGVWAFDCWFCTYAVRFVWGFFSFQFRLNNNSENCNTPVSAATLRSPVGEFLTPALEGERLQR